MDQQQLSVSQFGSKAGNYLTSAVHATGADLERLAALAHQQQPARALDLGCGAGHASFALARGGARRITAYDPAADMLAVVATEAAARGHAAIETCSGAAEVLPFDDYAFDLVVTRYSAHHWASVPRALAECARIITPGGRLVVIDVVSPEAPLFDTCLQVIEFLRDASHVRDYRLSEWRAMQQAAGFRAPAVNSWKLPQQFQPWVERIGTPPERVSALKAVFAQLPSEVREYFQVGATLSFTIDSAWLDAERA
jgi:ubiquinone/menaquinone biosynthesis C-methylase UbiE